MFKLSGRVRPLICHELQEWVKICFMLIRVIRGNFSLCE